ncbi:MAG TPA: aminoacyl-histidine dipeptidase [Lachnospiraceae bacterium]|nr:aminoacyl-histidine dipeptidase [Lachnospiraceae bacterium]
MKVLSKIEPLNVFQYFEEICGIPHGSGNMDAISQYLVKFAKERNLFYIQDESRNVIIIKEATKGYENALPVMIQGHMDMVAVKDENCDIDLEKDGLRLKTEGDYIFADGTSLGGDDGIAVAYALAILDSDVIPHPKLEVIFTVDEEVGMVGATAIDLSGLKGKRLLNIDSEEEGIILSSCAGGTRVQSHIPLDFEDREGNGYKIVITGLLGGHSGCEIQKERGNSNCLMGRILFELAQELDFSLCGVEGGSKDNAIALETSATIVIEKRNENQLIGFIKKIEQKFQKEFFMKDPGLKIIVTPITALELIGKKTIQSEGYLFPVLTKDSLGKVIKFLMMQPNGVQAMSAHIKGLVETSLNLGIIKTNKFELIADQSIRSSLQSSKEALRDKVVMISESLGGTCRIFGDYPAWEYKEDSKIRDILVDVYQRQYGKKPEIEAIHAGLECGIFSGKIKDLDCVSFGPNMKDIHTINERLCISSTKRVWEFLLEILKQCK